MSIGNALNISTPNNVVVTDGTGTPMASTNLPAGITLNSNIIATSTNGTFTPSITFGGGSTGITYTTQQGFYTLFPGAYFFSIYILLSNKGSDTGPVEIISLPFMSRDVGSAFLINNAVLQNASALPTGIQITTPNLSTVALLVGDSAVGSVPLDNSNFTNTTSVGVTGLILI